MNGLGGIGGDVRRASVRPELRRLRPGDWLVVEGADVGRGIGVRADGGGDDVETAGRRNAECRGIEEISADRRAALPAENAVGERRSLEAPAVGAEKDGSSRIARHRKASSTSVP